ncbi:MAG: AAA-like domain-containing protein [Polyangiaceae bacterium]|nr:AAA-like domain-containing protein [Polyangiaceae bacterium]
MSERSRAFQAGGPVRANGYYLRRAADDDLPNLLESGELCIVLGPRQLGKTSLRKSAVATLRQRGICCAELSVETIGRSTREPDWYYTLASQLVRATKSQLDLPEFWTSRAESDADRWYQVGLHVAREKGPCVVFLDEIDQTVDLEFRSDLFTSFRRLHEELGTSANRRALTFCLLGTATPGYLFTGAAQTFLNTAKRIPLLDFTMDEAAPLKEGLDESSDRDLTLRAVMEWTSGHPYMTQKVCATLMVEPRGDRTVQQRVDDAVRTSLLNPGIDDDNLGAAAAYLTESPQSLRWAMLQLFERVLSAPNTPTVSGDEAEQRLRIAGFLSLDGGRGGILRPRNRVFSTVFDATWVRRKEEEWGLNDIVRGWREAPANQKGDFALKGKALAKRVERSRTQLTPPQELEFLVFSQELERRRRLTLIIGATALALLVLVPWGRDFYQKSRLDARLAEVANQTEEELHNRLQGNASRCCENLREVAQATSETPEDVCDQPSKATLEAIFKAHDKNQIRPEVLNRIWSFANVDGPSLQKYASLPSRDRDLLSSACHLLWYNQLLTGPPLKTFPASIPPESLQRCIQQGIFQQGIFQTDPMVAPLSASAKSPTKLAVYSVLQKGSLKGPLVTACESALDDFKKKPRTIEPFAAWGAERGFEEWALQKFYDAEKPALAVITSLAYGDHGKGTLKDAVRWPELPMCRGTDQQTRATIVASFQKLIPADNEVVALFDLGPVAFMSQTAPTSRSDLAGKSFLIFGADGFARQALSAVGLSPEDAKFTNMSSKLDPKASSYPFGAFFPWVFAREFGLDVASDQRRAAQDVWKVFTWANNALGVVVANEPARKLAGDDVKDFVTLLTQKLTSASWAAHVDAKSKMTEISLPKDVKSDLTTWETNWRNTWKTGTSCKDCDKSAWENNFTNNCKTALP